MKNRCGIWIDSKKAVIVHLKEGENDVLVVDSGIEERIRIPGETKWLTQFATRFLNFEKRKENRRAHEVKNYLDKVIAEIKDVDELVLFGPASMKLELEKAIRKDVTHSSIKRTVETTDGMTENQIVAWVKRYFMTDK